MAERLRTRPRRGGERSPPTVPRPGGYRRAAGSHSSLIPLGWPGREGGRCLPFGAGGLGLLSPVATVMPLAHGTQRGKKATVAHHRLQDHAIQHLAVLLHG